MNAHVWELSFACMTQSDTEERLTLMLASCQWVEGRERMAWSQQTRLQSVGGAREFVAGTEAFALARGGGGGVLFQVELRTGTVGVMEVEMLRWSRTWMWRWIWWRRGVEVEVEQLTQWRDRIPPLSRCSTQTKVELSPSQWWCTLYWRKEEWPVSMFSTTKCSWWMKESHYMVVMISSNASIAQSVRCLVGVV